MILQSGKDYKKIVLFSADCLARLCLALIFLFAAVPKLLDLDAFAKTIHSYRVLSYQFVTPTAIALPIIEILLAVGLFLNSLLSKIGSALLLLGFIILLSYAIAIGLDIDCGCFGPSDPEYHAFHNLQQSLWRDVAMLIPLVYSFWFHWYKKLI